ncbi:hypothetical protein ACWGLF_32580 [Streptomyces puniciscabiei]
MDAQDALNIAGSAQQDAARSRMPVWAPPVVAGLFAAGFMGVGGALLPQLPHAWRWVLLGVAVASWVVMTPLAFRRWGGVVPQLGSRSTPQRWTDVAPTLVAGLVSLVVLATAGLAWMLIAGGVMLGAAEWFRLARRIR